MEGLKEGLQGWVEPEQMQKNESSLRLPINQLCRQFLVQSQ
jgi:hypothetical protein